jgi:hypothetical protein
MTIHRSTPDFLSDASALYPGVARAYRLVYGANQSSLALSPCASGGARARAAGCGAVASDGEVGP